MGDCLANPTVDELAELWRWEYMERTLRFTKRMPG